MSKTGVSQLLGSSAFGHKLDANADPKNRCRCRRPSAPMYQTLVQPKAEPAVAGSGVTFPEKPSVVQRQIPSEMFEARWSTMRDENASLGVRLQRGATSSRSHQSPDRADRSVSGMRPAQTGAGWKRTSVPVQRWGAVQTKMVVCLSSERETQRITPARLLECCSFIDPSI